VILDEPVRLRPESLADGSGQQRTYSLQFDGSWVGGLPEIWNELQANGFVVTPEIQARTVVLPASRIFTDASDASRTYLFKPLEISEYLVALPSYAGTLTTDAAAALDLAQVPTWQDHGMGSAPTGAVLRYSEGNPVTP
jgi:hypothetical protein